MSSGKYKIARSAGGVVINPKGLILVVNQNNNSWSLPKGHLDQGETALEAAQREIYEESGVHKLEFIKELGSYERPKIGLHGGDDKTEIKHITLFLFKTTQTILRPVDPDNPEAKWVSPEEVAGYLTHDLDKKYFLSLMPTLKNYLR